MEEISIFERAMVVARKTGDRVIVVDSKRNTAFVVLPFKEYERLVDESVETPLTTPRELDRVMTDTDEAVAESESLDADRFYLEPVDETPAV